MHSKVQLFEIWAPSDVASGVAKGLGDSGYAECGNVEVMRRICPGQIEGGASQIRTRWEQGARRRSRSRAVGNVDRKPGGKGVDEIERPAARKEIDEFIRYVVAPGASKR